MSRSPVATWADERGIEVLTPEKPRDPEFLDRLRELAPDCAPVVAYGALVPAAALEIPRHGWINLHFSLLPAWRGAAPVQHAVLHGDSITGASVFQLETGLDTGPVFGTVTEPIADQDTSGALLGRLAESGAVLLTQVLHAIASGDASAVTQPAEGISLAPKITREDSRIRWSDPAFAVDRRVRAVTPAPGAWTMWNDQRVRLAPVEPDPAGPKLEPGQVHAEKRGVWVGTGTEPVRLRRIQPPGKAQMDAEAWARGLQQADGIWFE